MAAWLGLLNAVANATFLFGYSEGNPNYLDVTTTTGSLSLSTATNPITPGSSNQGWWTAEPFPNDNFNDNFIVGDSGLGIILHNYFTFDISALSGQTVTGLVLNIQNPGLNDVSATYFLHDVSTDPYALAAKDNAPNAAIFSDLETGKLYGQQLIPLVNDPQYWIPLNAFATADLNAAISRGDTYFSIGGTIPEPSALALSSLGGLVLMGLQLRRRQRLSRGV
jgi:hypothetical protein